MPAYKDIKLALKNLRDWQVKVSVHGGVYRIVCEFKQGDDWVEVDIAQLKGGSDEYEGWPKPGFYRIHVYNDINRCVFPTNFDEIYTFYEDRHPTFGGEESGGIGDAPTESKASEAKYLRMLFDSGTDLVNRQRRRADEAEHREKSIREEYQILVDGFDRIQKQKQSAELQSADDRSFRLKAEAQRDDAITAMRAMQAERASFSPEIEAGVDALWDAASASFGLPSSNFPYRVRQSVENIAGVIVSSPELVRLFTDGGFFLYKDHNAANGATQDVVPPGGEAFWMSVRTVIQHYRGKDLGPTPPWCPDAPAPKEQEPMKVTVKHDPVPEKDAAQVEQSEYVSSYVATDSHDTVQQELPENQYEVAQESTTIALPEATQEIAEQEYKAPDWTELQ